MDNNTGTSPRNSDRTSVKTDTPIAGFNWFRFWVRVAIAVLVFNILAAIVTWYFIFPRLHPGMQ